MRRTEYKTKILRRVNAVRRIFVDKPQKMTMNIHSLSCMYPS